MQFEGIHHISAITGDARRNLDFYTRVLGLRLTAKTVNQDDPGVYHLFYGDEHAKPGADLTFFEYPHAIPGRPGAGMVHRIVHRVGGIPFWAERLEDEGVPFDLHEGTLRFSDPEGLDHEFVARHVGRRAADRGAPRDRSRASRSAASRACAPTRTTRRPPHGC